MVVVVVALVVAVAAVVAVVVVGDGEGCGVVTAVVVSPSSNSPWMYSTAKKFLLGDCLLHAVGSSLDMDACVTNKRRST